MTPPFDPYYKWLGIAPDEQPPNHYRLLGIRLFERDADVIESAADGRMVHLRTYQTGARAAWSQDLLTQVAAARVCLMDPKQRAAYDRQLQRQLASHDGSWARESPLRVAPAPPPPRLEESQPDRTGSDGDLSSSTIDVPGDLVEFHKVSGQRRSSRSTRLRRQSDSLRARRLKRLLFVVAGGAMLVIGVTSVMLLNGERQTVGESTEPISTERKSVSQPARRMPARASSVRGDRREQNRELDAVDLATLAEVPLDQEQNWTRDKGMWTANPNGARLVVPGPLPDEYILTLVVEAPEEESMLLLGLTASSRAFRCVLNARAPNRRRYSGLGMFDGHEPHRNSTTTHVNPFTVGRPCQIDVRITGRGITVSSDNRSIIDYTGGFEHLGMSRRWPAQDVPLSVDTFGGMKIVRMQLIPLSPFPVAANSTETVDPRPSSNGQTTDTSGSYAELEVKRMRPVVSGIAAQLPGQPARAVSYVLDPKPRSADIHNGLLDFAVVSSGVIYLVTSSGYEGNPSGGWQTDRMTAQQLVEHGWEELGACPWKPKETLLRRTVTAGESFQIRTNKYSPPQLIVPVE